MFGIDWLVLSTWALVAMVILGSVITIAQVGEYRPPLTGGTAVAIIAINIIIIFILLKWLGVV